MTLFLARVSGAVLVAGSVLTAGCAAGGTQPAAPASQPAAEEPAAPQSSPPVRTVQPGAPGEPSRVVAAKRGEMPGYTPADVAFMQGMIGHHAQAIEMVNLLETRTQSEDMRLLGHRIEVSQNDEIRMMQAWLRDRGEAVPAEHAHHMAGAKLMPGMLTQEQMSRLSAARAVEFDKLFLELMIQHHDGALTMVKELMAAPGAAQESNLFAFVSDVEADQSAEITRMRRMRAALGK